MNKHRKLYVRIVVIILSGMITWSLFLLMPFGGEDYQKARAHINLDMVSAALERYLYENDRWPSNSSEIPLSDERLRQFLKDGLVQCFVPLNDKNRNPVIVSVIDKRKGLYAILVEGRHIEKKVDKLPLEFDGYSWLK